MAPPLKEGFGFCLCSFPKLFLYFSFKNYRITKAAARVASAQLGAGARMVRMTQEVVQGGVGFISLRIWLNATYTVKVGHKYSLPKGELDLGLYF